MNLLSIYTSIVPSVRLIGHVDYVKPWKHFNRTINEYILYIVKTGELYIKEKNVEYHLIKGDVLLLEPNIEHYGYKEASCHYYYIHFKHPKISPLNISSYEEIVQKLMDKRKAALHSEYLSELSDTTPEFYLPKYYHYEDENELMSLLVNADSDYYHKYEGYKRIASLKLLEMLIKISRDYTSTKIESSQPQFSKAFVKCRNIQHYINSNYQNKITSADIEQNFESNYDYLNRVFQRMTGYSIMNYLNIIRVNRAKDLLDATPLKISEVGYLVGIDDPYYFSKLFKKISGITPSSYMKLKSKNSI
ncbi:AraC family transcriptional regulator [Inconstantimicrobium mannanitabidum]|uniref:AraC family transcriptional regulator n=1 Tax=Inconstantimicrobium mannanitabidum TaxID=1604901 RepID=A0ACB5REZ6_9CLOT|nr:AraC family transcriptional regulator [Clostridium sp. TW13]GKX67648.1 AraC family transcriptional regulator [Clostridium sp. TW13]